MLQPILLERVVHLVSRVQRLQVLKGGDAARIVGGEGWATEAFAEDLVAQALVRWVEGGGEDAALDL